MAFFTLGSSPSPDDDEAPVRPEKPESEGTRQRQAREQRRALAVGHDNGRVEEEIVPEDFQKY